MLTFTVVVINVSIQYFIFPLKFPLSFVGATSKGCENKGAITSTLHRKKITSKFEMHLKFEHALIKESCCAIN